MLFGKQAYKNRLQALEQALLATSTACCCRTHKHARVYWYYGNAHQFLAEKWSGWSGFNWTTFLRETGGRYHNNKHVRACACSSSMQC